MAEELTWWYSLSDEDRHKWRIRYPDQGRNWIVNDRVISKWAWDWLNNEGEI